MEALKSTVDTIIEAQRRYNRLLDEQITYRNAHPLPPLTRRQRLTAKLHATQQDARQRLALLIAPWLDDD